MGGDLFGSRASRFAGACILCLGLAVLGCSGDDALNSPTAAKLRGLSAMYLDHIAATGKPPASEQEFKKHLKAQQGFQLWNVNIDPNDIDAAFVSERDEQPFEILYGVGVTVISGDSKTVVAYEKTGKNGKRLVAFMSAKVDHVDDATLEKLKSAKE